METWKSQQAWNDPGNRRPSISQLLLLTHHVQLLLQRLDLRLHHLQQLLHLLVAEDGATGGSWRTKVSVTAATTDRLLTHSHTHTRITNS